MPRKGWEIPEREATPEDVYINRRRFLKAMGITSLGAAGLWTGCSSESSFEPFVESPGSSREEEGSSEVEESLYPAPHNEVYTLDRPLTLENVAATYNNFYEFSFGKAVWKNVGKFTIDPWKVEVTGKVNNPKTYDIDDLIRKMPLEERLYRLRCVEAWSMALPWTGFPMTALIKEVEPLSSARYVKMTTFLNPREADGQWNRPEYPWPYQEGLTMEEAMNELTLLATGIYGHELPKQHGAPIRLVVPWKYGFKSIKSIVRIEFTEYMPATMWNTLVPREYDFWANVNPNVPHPRWSQAEERFIVNNISGNDLIPTQLYNGYADYVAHLYL